MPRKKPEPILRGSVEERKVPARALVTVTSEEGETDPRRVEWPGAIVRIRPKASDTEQRVEEMKRELQRLGAERVVVLPRPRAEVVPEREKRAQRPEDARAAVASLVAESSVEDRGSLASLCEEIMARNGL